MNGLLLDLFPGLRDLDFITKVVLEGVGLLSASAGVIGCFAVLRRRALTGDALSHAALPGLCAAFILVGERDFFAMLLGAFVSGLCGIAVIALLRHFTRIKEDAAIGIVLSVFFGAGVVLASLIQHMEGGSTAGLDSFILGKTAGMLPEDLQWIRVLTLASLLLVGVLFKEFRLVSFDPGFARVQGWPTLGLDLLLMMLIAVAVIVGLPAVGVMMMAALLILPAASARFWTDRLGTMLVLSALFGMSAGVTGTLISASLPNWPTGPTIILVAAVLFLLSVLLAPRRGGLARWLAQRRFQRDLARRQLLLALYELAEPSLPNPPAFARTEVLARKDWSPRGLNRLLADAVKADHVRCDGEYVTVTATGLHAASEATRRHRLWAAALRDNPELTAALTDFETDIDAVLPVEVVRVLSQRLAAEGRLPPADLLLKEAP